MSYPLNTKRTKSVPLEVTMMKRIAELKAEITYLKSEVDRLKNNVVYLDTKLAEEMDKAGRLFEETITLQNRCDFLEGKDCE